MKRGQPLRRTPLARGAAFPKQRSPIRARSSKATARQAERVAMLKATGADLERCQWPGGCTERATDADERLTRGRGGSATDRDNIDLYCRPHHQWKHEHPAEAQAMGIMPSQWPK